jgi:hypothetical protein
VKVVWLLVLMVVEGQPLELVEDLVSVAPPVGQSVADVLRKALQRVVAALRSVSHHSAFLAIMYNYAFNL